MHSEFYILPQETADLVNKTKSNGKRVISVGTTATRVLETVGTEKRKLEQKQAGRIYLFIRVSEFHVIDALITNSHFCLSQQSIMLCKCFWMGQKMC